MQKRTKTHQHRAKKKTGHDFDKITKHSTWNLLTGCYDPFIHRDTDHDDKQASTKPKGK